MKSGPVRIVLPGVIMGTMTGVIIGSYIGHVTADYVIRRQDYIRPLLYENSHSRYVFTLMLVFVIIFGVIVGPLLGILSAAVEHWLSLRTGSVEPPGIAEQATQTVVKQDGTAT